MKEVRLFYTPNIANSQELPDEESTHVTRVLRMKEGDEILLTDGKGTFYRAALTLCSPKHCFYEIIEALPQQRAWRGHLHLAVAPTKRMERMEWMAEKITEIGFDELSFLNCDFSERKELKVARIDKIVIAAMKQSHKAWKPVLNEMKSFNEFIQQPFKGERFIAHCYEEPELNSGEKINLVQHLVAGDATVLIGPEGDFSVKEVKAALAHGFRPISLGKSRLRTETAALVAVHIMNMINETDTPAL